MVYLWWYLFLFWWLLLYLHQTLGLKGVSCMGTTIFSTFLEYTE
jgi:hypothetical protein